MGPRRLEGRCLRGTGTARLSADKRSGDGFGGALTEGGPGWAPRGGVPEEFPLGTRTGRLPRGRGPGAGRGPNTDPRRPEDGCPGEKQGARGHWRWSDRTRLATCRRAQGARA